MFLKAFHLKSLINTASPSSIITRSYAFKSDLKIKWVRPEKPTCWSAIKSGDLDKFEAPDPSKLIPHFEKSQELKDADDVVRNFFSLGMNNRKMSRRIFKKQYIDSVKRHNSDLGSVEAKIADMTATIRANQDEFTKQFRNRSMRVPLKELIDKRKKYLMYLRKWDYRRFEWILEKLNIVFKPYPEHFHWITRKESLRKLTDIHCEKLRQDKLDTYRKHLEAQQLSFLKKKIENLQFIRKEQLECKVPVTVTQDQIQVLKKEYEELKTKREEEEEISKQMSAKEDYELKL